MKISFRTFGCKLNQAETDMLKQDLLEKGFFIVPFGQKADISIIRGCGVTCSASQRTREAVRQAKRLGSYVIVNGCVENVDLSAIDFVADTIEGVISHCEEERARRQNDFDEFFQLSCNHDKIKTRKFIKIQTGCNFQCAYCIIPTFRGKSNSEPVEKIIKQIRQAEKDGFKEIVLTGINIGQYCFKNEKIISFVDLLKIILQETIVQRIRLGSLDPRLIDDELLELYIKRDMMNSRLMPHWHLSLQSGANSVLKRMGRGYTTEKYLTIINKIKKFNPLFSFTTDIIVGFPGETADEFRETCDFISQVGFSKVHVFPFSPRPKTPAIKLKPIQNSIVSKRVKKLTKIVDEVGNKYKQQLIGKNSQVLFENQKEGNWFGYCAEYVKIKHKSATNLENSIKNIILKKDIINL